MTVEQILADHFGSLVKWVGIFWGGVSAIAFLINFIIKDPTQFKKGLKKVRIDGE